MSQAFWILSVWSGTGCVFFPPVFEFWFSQFLSASAGFEDSYIQTWVSEETIKVYTSHMQRQLVVFSSFFSKFWFCKFIPAAAAEAGFVRGCLYIYLSFWGEDQGVYTTHLQINPSACTRRHTKKHHGKQLTDLWGGELIHMRFFYCWPRFLIVRTEVSTTVVVAEEESGKLSLVSSKSQQKLWNMSPQASGRGFQFLVMTTWSIDFDFEKTRTRFVYC